MSWERDVAAFLDDLEGQAEAVLRSERDWEVIDQARAEYATIGFVTRLMASQGRELDLQLLGLGQLRGRLERCTESWSLVDDGHREWVVRHPAVLTVAGVSERSLPREAWPRAAAVGIGSAMRRLADTGELVMVVLTDGNRCDGTWGRIGKDFAELIPVGAGGTRLVPHRAISAFTTARAAHRTPY